MSMNGFASNFLTDLALTRRTGTVANVIRRRKAVLADVTQQYGEDADEIGTAIGDYRQRKSGMYRAYNKKFPKIGKTMTGTSV